MAGITGVDPSQPCAQKRDYGAAKEKVGDWGVLMQGLFPRSPRTRGRWSTSARASDWRMVNRTLPADKGKLLLGPDRRADPADPFQLPLA